MKKTLSFKNYHGKRCVYERLSPQEEHRPVSRHNLRIVGHGDKAKIRTAQKTQSKKRRR